MTFSPTNRHLRCRRRGDGLSKSYASQVRAGKFTSHVSTWPVLAALAGVEVQALSHLPSTITGAGFGLRSAIAAARQPSHSERMLFRAVFVLLQK